MTHGPELGAGMLGVGQTRGNKGEKKKWDNCNSIINKIYFKNEKMKEKIKYTLYTILCEFQVYNIVIRHYIIISFRSDHPDKSSNQLSLYKLLTISILYVICL